MKLPKSGRGALQRTIQAAALLIASAARAAINHIYRAMSLSVARLFAPLTARRFPAGESGPQRRRAGRDSRRSLVTTSNLIREGGMAVQGRTWRRRDIRAEQT